MSSLLLSLPEVEEVTSTSSAKTSRFAPWGLVNKVMYEQFGYQSEVVARANTMLDINSLAQFHTQNPYSKGEMADIWLYKLRKALKQSEQS
jgi:hypothetical protein